VEAVRRQVRQRVAQGRAAQADGSHRLRHPLLSRSFGKIGAKNVETGTTEEEARRGGYRKAGNAPSVRGKGKQPEEAGKAVSPPTAQATGTASRRKNGSAGEFFRAARAVALLSRFLQGLPSVRGRRSFRGRENPLLPLSMTPSRTRHGLVTLTLLALWLRADSRVAAPSYTGHLAVYFSPSGGGCTEAVVQILAAARVVLCHCLQVSR